MPFQSFPIYDLKSGQITAREPWLIPADAFKKLRNGHIYHGVLEKRKGYTEFGKMVKTETTTASVITHFADAGSGKVTVTTSSAHGLSNDATVVQTGTTSYNGTFVISEKAATTFKIVATWVADDATGIVSSVPGNAVMGIYNYYQGDVETLLAMDTKRVNKYNTTSHAFEDVTRLKIHFKPGASQNHLPVANDVCEGATNGAYGTVESVIVDHGSCPLGTGDGWIIFKNATVVGTFLDGENLRDQGTPAEIYGDADGTQTENEFTGEDNNFFWLQNWLDVGYFTNYIDQIQRYGAGSILTPVPFQIDLAVEGGPDNDMNTCLLIFIYHNRIILFRTNETDGAHNRRARWCEINNPAIWKAASYKDAPTEDWIISADFIGDELYVWFERTIWIFAYTNDPTEPFKWEQVASTEGCYATMSVISFSDELMAVGPTQIVGFDRRKAYNVDEKIPDFMLEWTQAAIGYCYGLVLEEMKQAWISYASIAADKPDSALIINYEENCFSTYELPIHVLGYSQLSADLILDEIDASIALDDIDYSFDDKDLQAGYPTTLMGCRTGYIYKLNDGGSDDGADISFETESGQLNPFVKEGKQACLGWIDFLVDKDELCTFDVDFYLNDESLSYQTKTITCSETGTNRDKVWKRIYSGAIADFHRIDIGNNAINNRPRIHCINLYFDKCGAII